MLLCRKKRSMRTKYQYENLNEIDFENLIIAICQNILGIGCKTFSQGKDEGKDSWFEGKAENFPSCASQWEGVFVIQAKHTTSSEASCSDNNFYKNQTSIVSKEINRLLEVQKQHPFDNYLLFTNRKLTGGEHPEITNRLISELNIKNADVVGKEQLDSYLASYPKIVLQFGLHKFNAPERFYEKDIQEVILLFSDVNDYLNFTPCNSSNSLLNIDKKEKNLLNDLSDEYFDFIKKQSLPYFVEIEKFLKDPKNKRYTLKYQNTIADLQAYIIQHRGEFPSFMEIIEHIVNTIVDLDKEEIKDRRNLFRIFVHFMYFNCDIGKIK